MARPPKNQQEPSAVERMVEAFWQILERKPFAKITVSEIVKEAHVNRNAFYYHYESIDDLAQKAVQALLIADGLYMVAEIIKTNGAYLSELLNSSERREMLRRIRLTASSHSSPELTDMLKQAVINMWFTSFEVSEEDLDPDALVVLSFAVGGFMEILGKWVLGESSITPQAVVNSGMATTVAELVANTLAPASHAKEKVEEIISLQTPDEQATQKSEDARAHDRAAQESTGARAHDRAAQESTGARA